MNQGPAKGRRVLTTRQRFAILCAAVALGGLCALQAQSIAARGADPKGAPEVTFHSGTRLVEVEVVARDRNGPVTGLTRDDFTLLDAGKRQPIAVFHAQTSSVPSAATGDADGHRLPAGAFSNRAEHNGHSINGATVLLLDQLNTAFDNQGYARKQLLKFLESSPDGEQVAIYLLGKKLTVLQDFSDDRDTLTRAVRKWNPENLGVLIVSDELMDETDRKAANMSSPFEQLIRNQITGEAIAKIAQHLSGIPGRRNLVWVSDTPGLQGVGSIFAANIHLYPVLTRGVGTSGVVAWTRDTREMGRAAAFGTPAMPFGNEFARQHANSALAAANGTSAFMDSRDISMAVHTALEDTRTSYVLGFYPPEETLDNKFHAITVSVGRAATARGKALDIHHRPGYFASVAAPPPAPKASLNDLLRNPLDGSAIGITAAADSTLGQYAVTVTVDLRDVHFKTEDKRHNATLALSFADDASQEIQTKTLSLTYSDEEFASALDRGLSITRYFEKKSAVRIVVQDGATGLAGSLRVVPADTTPLR
jgi:VWFA-related protein